MSDDETPIQDMHIHGRLMSDSLTCLDLFAGAGGMTLGLEAAGFENLGAIEHDDVASATFSANFGNRPLSFLGENGDIREIDPEALPKRLERSSYDSVDLITAAPPCQGFSRVGRGKLNSLADGDDSFVDDERNSLFRHALTLVDSLLPSAFLLENVPGMLNLGGHNVVEEVCLALENRNYTVRSTVLNSAWYGVPQTRRRIFILAYRDELNLEPVFPERTHRVASPGRKLGNETGVDWKEGRLFTDPDQIPEHEAVRSAVTVSDAFEDLPPFTDHLEALETGEYYSSRRDRFGSRPYRCPPTNTFVERMREWEGFESAQVDDHFCRWTPRDFETFSRMEPGEKYPQAVEYAHERFEEAKHAWGGEEENKPEKDDFIPPYPTDSFQDKWRKLDPDRPSWTVTAHLSKDTYSHIHYDSREARGISIREAARLQSIPDGFILKGCTGDAYRQVGNAVPPRLAEALGQRIYKDLTNNRTRKGAPHDVESDAKTRESPVGA